MILPKPTKRVRARKPIARKSRPRKARKTSAGAKARTADRLFSLIVRSRVYCLFHHSGGECAGPLQTCHIVSRTYRSVRWDEDNAFCMCAGAHRLMTNRPLEWERFVTAVMTAGNYEALKIRALKPWDHDIESVLVRLAARAVALGIKP